MGENKKQKEKNIAVSAWKSQMVQVFNVRASSITHTWRKSLF